MESLIQFAFENVEYVHIIGFFLILLGGINLPISEDIVLISTGALTATMIPQSCFYVFTWLFFACWFSAWEAYWIGRILGPKLYNIRWFNYIINPKKINNLHSFYERFGPLVFFVGRFIPGGVRNCLFMSCGLGEMPFYKFILRDCLACLLSASFLYSLGFLFGQNFESIVHFFKIYHNTALIIIISIVIPILLFRTKQIKSRKSSIQ